MSQQSPQFSIRLQQMLHKQIVNWYQPYLLKCFRIIPFSHLHKFTPSLFMFFLFLQNIVIQLFTKVLNQCKIYIYIYIYIYNLAARSGVWLLRGVAATHWCSKVKVKIVAQKMLNFVASCPVMDITILIFKRFPTKPMSIYAVYTCMCV